MNIIPKKDFEINSPLSEAETIVKFQDNLKKTTDLGIFGIRQNGFFNYEGFIIDNVIVFRRILKKGANSFIPKMEATISETPNGTNILFKSRLNKFIGIFVLIFNIFLLTMTTLVLWNIKIRFDLESLRWVLTPIFMLLVANGMMRIVFSFETYRLEQDFRRILKSNQKSENGNWLNSKIADSIFGNQ